MLSSCSESTLRPTRLAVVTETWPPDVNGVAYTISTLIKSLGQRGDYNVQLIRPRQSATDTPQQSNYLTEHLVPGLRLPFYREVRLGMPQRRQLQQLWQQERPDIVQIVTEGPLGYSAMRAAKALNIPLVSDFHTHFDQYSRYYQAGFVLRWIERYLRYLHNQTLLTFVPTEQLSHQLSTQGYQSLRILARGIDTELFNPGRRSQTIRQRLGVGKNDLLVILVTRLAQEKNLRLAIKAYRAIQQVIPNSKFVLVGDGPERERLQQQHPDLLFSGMRRGEELAQYYASGDLFIYPSTSETFGNVILEALASGLPVVTYNYAAAYAHMVDGVNGRTVAFDQADEFIATCVELAQDSAQRQRLALAAAMSIQHLSWRQVAEHLHQQLQTVLGASHENATTSQ